MLVYVDKRGEQRFERNTFSLERKEIMDNPYFEDIYKYS